MTFPQNDLRVQPQNSLDEHLFTNFLGILSTVNYGLKNYTRFGCNNYKVREFLCKNYTRFACKKLQIVSSVKSYTRFECKKLHSG